MSSKIGLKILHSSRYAQETNMFSEIAASLAHYLARTENSYVK